MSRDIAVGMPISWLDVTPERRHEAVNMDSDHATRLDRAITAAGHRF
jgi:hypothetical protein